MKSILFLLTILSFTAFAQINDKLKPVKQDSVIVTLKPEQERYLNELSKTIQEAQQKYADAVLLLFGEPIDEKTFKFEKGKMKALPKTNK